MKFIAEIFYFILALMALLTAIRLNIIAQKKNGFKKLALSFAYEHYGFSLACIVGIFCMSYGCDYQLIIGIIMFISVLQLFREIFL